MAEISMQSPSAEPDVVSEQQDDDHLFVLTVHFQIDPRFYESFLREMLANAHSSRTLELGCLQFDVCEDPDITGHVFLYEIYEDAFAFEQHKRERHFLDFDRKVASWVMKKDVKILRRLAPARLERTMTTG